MRLHLIPQGARRDTYLPLFRLADDSEREIRAYYQTGQLFGLEDNESGEPYGHVLVTPTSQLDTVEFKSTAIAVPIQGKGIGRQFLRDVIEYLRAASVRRIVVGTSNASVGNLAFYQKVGFRLWRIERDYFSTSKGYKATCVEDGIRVRDMVWMDLEL